MGLNLPSLLGPVNVQGADIGFIGEEMKNMNRIGTVCDGGNNEAHEADRLAPT
jgi:hypothetical protein